MNPNQGSFGAAIGGADPLQEAIARRQTGQAGAMQQVSPASATFDPSTMAPPIQGGPMGGLPPQGLPQEPAMPFESTESVMIIKALDSRLKSISKKEQLGL